MLKNTTDKEIKKSSSFSGKLTASQAILLLAKNGVTVSETEATSIVEMINFLAEITIKQILDSGEFTIELQQS